MIKSLKQLRKCLYYIAKSHNTKLVITNTSTHGGGWHRSKRRIEVSAYWLRNSHEQIEFFLSSFFHELGHQYNHDCNHYPIYHKTDNQNKPGWMQTAWKAEVFTDKVGRKLMKAYFPTYEYLPGYEGLRNDPKTWDYYQKWLEK